MGTIGELLAAADLLKRGWTVYRSLSPAAWADLIAFKDRDTFVPFEVRTGQMSVEGVISYTRTPNDVGKNFIVVIWSADGPILRYFPALDNATPTFVPRTQS